MYSVGQSDQPQNGQDGEHNGTVAGVNEAADGRVGEREENQNVEEPEAVLPLLSNSFLFACIYGRCADASASVRAQALKSLGDITTEQSQGVKEVISKIFASGKADRGQLSIPQLLEDESGEIGRAHV